MVRLTRRDSRHPCHSPNHLSCYRFADLSIFLSIYITYALLLLYTSYLIYNYMAKDNYSIYYIIYNTGIGIHIFVWTKKIGVDLKLVIPTYPRAMYAAIDPESHIMHMMRIHAARHQMRQSGLRSLLWAAWVPRPGLGHLRSMNNSSIHHFWECPQTTSSPVVPTHDDTSDT